MGKAHAIVEGVMRLALATTKSVGVLYVGLYAVGVEHVLGSHAVYHIEVFARMRNAVVA